VDEVKEYPNSSKIKFIKLENCKEAQGNGIYPYGTYCVICDGERTLYQRTLKKQIQSIINI